MKFLIIVMIIMYSTCGFGNILKNIECEAENRPMIKELSSELVTFDLDVGDVKYFIIVDARFQGLDILGSVNLSNSRTFFGGGFDSRGLFSYSSHLSNGRLECGRFLGSHAAKV